MPLQQSLNSISSTSEQICCAIFLDEKAAAMEVGSPLVKDLALSFSKPDEVSQCTYSPVRSLRFQVVSYVRA